MTLSADFSNETSHLSCAENYERRERLFDERLTTILISAGIPTHVMGYAYLRKAVELVIEKPEAVNRITKLLYPEVANTFNMTSSRVERDMRHAIEIAWSKGKIENINAIYGIKIFDRNEKPTTGEFVALIADKLMLEFCENK